jgi:predicted TIM-barrel fold metal-dependent hydrolase
MTTSSPSLTPGKDQNPHIAIRPAWLALHSEPALEPALPIIDAHHHLWEFPGRVYRSSDLLGDAASGHNLRATVFIECQTHYRTEGPEAFKSVGEVEFVMNEVRLAKASGAATDVAVAIVANADMRLGAAVAPVLNALIAASAGRVHAIRNIAVWHADRSFKASAANPPRELMLDAGFQEGVRQLAPLNLTFDAWAVHPQIDEVCSLAAACPDTKMVLNHVGGPLGVGPYRGRREEVFQTWRDGMRRLARHGNVSVKLGGFGMTLFGFDFYERPRPPTSEDLATAFRPYVEACIEAFGVNRCMFESNFPVDKGNFSYGVLWNAFKRVAGGASASEKAALFHDTAAGFYRIP